MRFPFRPNRRLIDNAESARGKRRDLAAFDAEFGAPTSTREQAVTRIYRREDMERAWDEGWKAAADRDGKFNGRLIRSENPYGGVDVSTPESTETR